ncbi:RNA polymerase sigma factor [Pacificibacter marinus]|uniref:RNA polymerase sigma factor n=1 Tax=Pacificibacter marinus TaxID=658057 RepID=UPI001FCCF9AD|nr:RNA polymerase sigma factor [Pacificibacter marinus]
MTSYLDHWHNMRARLVRRLGSHDLADEAMQETWLRLDGMKPANTTIANPQAYLLSIAGNIAIDLIRKEKRHSDRMTYKDVNLEELIDNAPSTEAVLLAREDLKQLVRALLGLSDKARKVLLMNRSAGLSHREIAAALGISESMVAKYMAQALRHCRDYMRENS